MLAKVPLKAMHHVLVFELLVGSVIINDGKQGHFVTEETYDEIVCGRIYVLNLFLKSVFFQNYHLVLKNIPIVLFQQFFVGEVDTQLLQRVISKIFKSKNI